ncbi:hypothetical protein [Streptomyces sp. NPDC059533]|uniref:hypothetical protein n=1 Tax=unclassified Streptomyces TaxID=2593676 RepID=UPI0036B9B91B
MDANENGTTTETGTGRVIGAGVGDARRTVAALPWGAAVAAVAVAVTMSLVLGGRDFLGLLLFQSPIVLPLLMRWAPKAFAAACFAVGAPMLFLGMLIALFGIPAFLVAPALLIVAALADRADRHTGTRARGLRTA